MSDTSKDIKFLYDCLYQAALGNSYAYTDNFSKIEDIVYKYGFKIDEEGYLESK
jgi:hypothetical protein